MSGNFDAIISNGMASIRASAEAAGRSVSGFADKVTGMGNASEKQFRRIGEAITKMGGPLAEIGGKMFGAAGMEGGFARLAVAAALVGIAFKAMSSVMDVSQKRTEALIAATRNLDNAYKNAAKSAEDFAAGSEEIGKTKAKAENLFGHGAGDIAKDMAKKYGIEEEDVLKAMSSAAAIPREQRMKALVAASAAASSGQVTAAAGMSAMRDRPTRERVLGQHNRNVAGVPIKDEQAQGAMLIMSMEGMHGQTAFEESALMVGGRQGPSGDQLRPLSQGKNVETGARVSAFDSGKTAAATTKRAVESSNPLAAEMIKLLESETKKAEESRAKAREHQRNADETTINMPYKLAELILMALDENEARRTEIATGAAVVGRPVSGTGEDRSNPGPSKAYVR